jgi:hypothetical protein
VLLQVLVLVLLLEQFLAYELSEYVVVDFR